MTNPFAAHFSVVRIFIFSSFLWLTLVNHLLFANPSTVSSVQESAAPTSDEMKIAEDRDRAILDAVNGISKKPAAELKSKKIKLSEAEKKERSWKWPKLKFWTHEKRADSLPRKDGDTPAMVEQPTKRVSSSEFFSKPDQSPNFEEVKKKRTKRLRQFPKLDPDAVKDAITETKIEMKKEFINMGEHSLESAIRRAISVHLPAQIAHERIVLAERRILKAFRDFFPSADLTTTKKDGTISSGPYKHNDWRVNLRQPLFKGGILWNTFQVEMANREVARRELDVTVSEIVSETSKAYLEYERAWNVLRDKETLLGISTKLKSIADQKAKAALVSDIERLNMDSLFGQAEYDMETARQDLELAKLELQRVLELDIADPIEIKSMIQIDSVAFPESEAAHAADDQKTSAENIASVSGSRSLSVEGKDLEHFIDMAYMYRPDLQVEAAKLRAAHLSHKISLGKHLPEADMIVEFGKLGEAFEGTDLRFQGDLETTEPRLKTEWRIGAELAWKLGGNTLGYNFDHDQRAPSVSQFQSAQGPISDTHTFSLSLLDNLNSLAELKETKIAALEQVLQLERSERDAIREIKEAYFNYNKALIQAESVYKKMKYREKLSKLAEHRHSNNEIQVSEYLQAEMDYNQERAALHKAMADFYLAKVNLNRAIGIRDYLKIEAHQFETR